MVLVRGRGRHRPWPWNRRPREVLDVSRGAAWARWWTGGAFNWAAAALEPRAARDPDGGRAHVGGRGRRGAEPAPRRAARGVVRPAARQLPALGLGPGTASASSCRCSSRRSSRCSRSPARRDVHADLLGLRRRRPSRRGCADCEATLLITADGFLRRGQRVHLKASPTRRSRRRRASSACWSSAARATRWTVPWDRGRDAWWHDALDGRRRDAAAEAGRDATPRRRTWSSTPRARPARRRARSMSTAASRSRPRRTSRTPSTCAPATRCSGSPTSAG